MKQKSFSKKAPLAAVLMVASLIFGGLMSACNSDDDYDYQFDDGYETLASSHMTRAGNGEVSTEEFTYYHGSLSAYVDTLGYRFDLSSSSVPWKKKNTTSHGRFNFEMHDSTIYIGEWGDGLYAYEDTGHFSNGNKYVVEFKALTPYIFNGSEIKCSGTFSIELLSSTNYRICKFNQYFSELFITNNQPTSTSYSRRNNDIQDVASTVVSDSIMEDSASMEVRDIVIEP